MARRTKDPRRTSGHRFTARKGEGEIEATATVSHSELASSGDSSASASAESGAISVPSAGSADLRPEQLYNPPGQSRLRFRVGTQSSFYERLVAQLPEQTLPDGVAQGNRPLRRLTTRDPQDPTLALLWAFSGVGDILTFYQQEILNEGYVGTAIERLSLVELARLVGYEPTPPVSAEVLLAVSAEETDDATVPDEYFMPAGTAVASTPETENQLPQVFESSLPLVARARWNALRPQQTRRQLLGPTSDSLWLAGVDTGLETASRMLLVRRGVDADGAARFAWREVVVQEVVPVEDETGEEPVLERTFVRWDGALGLSFFWLPPEGEELPLVEVFALRESASLFGYDVPPWDSQPWEVKLAHTPPGFVPQDFDDWPGLELDLQRIALDAEYPAVISGGWLVLERPAALTVVEAGVVTTVNRNSFTLSGQVTEVRPALTATVPCGTTLVPSRELATATRLPDGKVLVIGGFGEPEARLQRGAVTVPEPLASVQILDPVTGTVSATGALLEARGGHTATLLGDQTVLVMGGVGASGATLASAELYHLEGEAAGTFTAVTSVLPVSRTAHTATLLPQGQVLVVGGLHRSNGRLDVLQVCALYDPATATFVGPTTPSGVRPKPLVLHQARAWHTASMLAAAGTSDPRLLVTGGVGAGFSSQDPLGEALASVEFYDPAPQLFTTAAAMAQARSHHTASVVVTTDASGSTTGTQVLVAGGRATHTAGSSQQAVAVATLELYDNNADAWSDAGSLDQGRYDHSATALADGTVVLAGGTTLVTVAGSLEPVPETLATVEAWLPSVGAPRRRESLAEPRSRHGAALLADGWLVLTGGWRAQPTVLDPEAGTPLGSIDFYQPRSATFIAAGAQPFTAIASAVAPLTSGKVLVAGGFGAPVVGADGDQQPQRILRETALFDPHTNLYTSLGNLHTGRSGASATLLPGGAVLVAGGILAVFDPQVEALKEALEATKAALEAMEDPVDDLTVQADVVLNNLATVRSELYNNQLSVKIAAYYVAMPLANWGDLSWEINGLVNEKGSKTYYYNTSESFSKRYSDILASVLDTPLAAIQSASQQIQADARSIQSNFQAAADAIDAALAIVGKLQAGDGLFAAELFDPASQRFSPAAYPMVYYRVGHTATLLPDGRVLLAGGIGFPWTDLPDDAATGGSSAIPALRVLASTEIYDPFTGEFTAVGAMSTARIEHTATALADGQVLIVGGSDGTSALATAQLFDPVTQTFSATAGSMAQARMSATATLLPSGSVLVVGGNDGSAVLASSEVFDPLSLKFSPRGSMAEARKLAGAELLPDGRVLVAGGMDSAEDNLATAELYVDGTFVPTGSLAQARSWFTSAVLPGGDVLVTGGVGNAAAGGPELATAERYVARAQRPQPNEIPGTAVWLDSEALPLARMPLEIPLWGDRVVLEGEQPQLTVGQTLLFSGRRPLVRYTGLVVPSTDVGAQAAAVGNAPLGGRGLMPSAELTAFTGSPRKPIQLGEALTLLRAPGPFSSDGEVKARGFELWSADNLSSEVSTLLQQALNLETKQGFAGTTEAESFSYVVDNAPDNVRPVAEAAVIRQVGEPRDGLTNVWLDRPLFYVYDRTTVTVNANTVAATQGETVDPVVLGSGDGSLKNQVFRLPEGPLTRLADLNPSGFLNTLEVRVDDVLWKAVDNLFTAGPLDQAYAVQQSFQNQTEIIFGDGVNGARLPSGEDNVVAYYRLGAGVGGNVGAETLTQLLSPPPGIAGVTNPIAAEGGAAGEPPRELRQRVPLHTTDLGRILAVEDFRSFALAFAGVAKAASVDGRVWGVDALVSIVPRDEPRPDDLDAEGILAEVAALEQSPLFVTLREAIVAAIAPGITYRLLAVGVHFFNLTLRVMADPRYDLKSLERSLRASLLVRYGFQRRELGEGVAASDILSAVQARQEVFLVDMEELYYSGEAIDDHPFLSAQPPRWEADGRAHLLLINPQELRLIIEEIES